MDAETWKYEVLRLLAHEVNKQDLVPNRKRSLLLWKLKAMGGQLRASRQYTYAVRVSQVYSLAVASDSIRDALAEQKRRAGQTPASNTGVESFGPQLESLVARDV